MTLGEQWKRAANAVIGMFDGVGRGAVHVSIAQETALVELMLHDVRDQIVKPPAFLQWPAHLPDEDDLRKLLIGDVAKDQQLRVDAHEWAAINRRVSGQSAVVLRNAVTAIRTADRLLDDPDADEKLHEWKIEIAAYVDTIFECDTREAPHELDQLELWCVAITNKANPVPEWLQYWNRLPMPERRRKTNASNIGRHALAAATERDDD